jgi:hypothetical protein
VLGFFLMKKVTLNRIYINLPEMKRPGQNVHYDSPGNENFVLASFLPVRSGGHLAKTQLIFTDESGK